MIDPALHIKDPLVGEVEKYNAIWNVEDYQNAASLGELFLDTFMEIMTPSTHSSIIDLGCGRGHAGLRFQNMGMRVWWLDVSDAGLDPQVPRNRFLHQPLWSDWTLYNRMGWDYAYCVDCLEHLPTEYTLLAIERIARSCRHAWIIITLTPDNLGSLIGQPLHLTVRPYDWWLSRLASVGRVVEARDLIQVGLYRMEK